MRTIGMAPACRYRVQGDRGQVSSWVVKLVVWGGILGFLFLEVGSVVLNRVQTQDLAGQAATEANLAYDGARGVEAAEQRAVEFVGEKAEVLDVSLDPTSSQLSVTIRKTARTFLIHRVQSMADLAVVTITESVPLRVP